MLTKFALAAYPAILEVMALIDCGVIEDANTEGADAQAKPLFNLGIVADPAAGVHGLTASPSFNSLSELNVFCNAHMDQFDAVAAELDRTHNYPDAWFWDVTEPA